MEERWIMEKGDYHAKSVIIKMNFQYGVNFKLSMDVASLSQETKRPSIFANAADESCFKNILVQGILPITNRFQI